MEGITIWGWVGAGGGVLGYWLRIFRNFVRSRKWYGERPSKGWGKSASWVQALVPNLRKIHCLVGPRIEDGSFCL